MLRPFSIIGRAEAAIAVRLPPMRAGLIPSPRQVAQAQAFLLPGQFCLQSREYV